MNLSMRHTTAVLGALGLAVVGAGCGDPASVPDPVTDPTWQVLAPLAVLETPVVRHPWRENRELRIETEGDATRFLLPILPEDWSMAGPRLWRADLPRIDALTEALSLEDADGPLPRVEIGLLEHEGEAWNAREGSLLLAGYEGRTPGAFTFVARLAYPGPESGARLRQRLFSGTALTLYDGMRASCRVEVPPDSALTFGTSHGGLMGGIAPGKVHYRIRLDGETIFEHTADTHDWRGCTWHRVILPPEGRAEGELVFEVEGSLAVTSFLSPVLGPASIGRPGSRPWPEQRPDLVLFLADTFRADNLSAYGSQANVTPNLDRLAASGLCFLDTWSTAAWTLPAHATLLSGFYPPQAAGTYPTENGLVPAIETVAERLSAAGYRTAAFTDGGFVSSTFGLDQGFDVFVEISEDLKDLDLLLAQARAFLDDDDGRPTFLFVQTYRAHWPYTVSEETRAALGERLGLDESAEALFEQISAEAAALGAEGVDSVEAMETMPPEPSPRLEELYRRLHHLYLGGVADLDRGLGPFLDALRERGTLDHGYLVFTSDHGEAFGEHAALFHSADPFEEQVRVPLLVVGRDLPGLLREAPASLIDVAPTLAEMAGLPPDPDWPGRSLLNTGEEARQRDALFSFESSSEPGETLCVLRDGKKVLLRTDDVESGVLQGAYDLARDPHERADLSASSQWPPALLEASRQRLEEILSTRIEGEALSVDEGKMSELRALGYGR